MDERPVKGNKEKRDEAAGLDASNEMKLKSELVRSRELQRLCNRRPSSDFLYINWHPEGRPGSIYTLFLQAFTATVHSLL